MKQLSRFVAVGASAAGVHYLVVVLLVSLKWLTPAKANVFAFLTAFWVSYFGHRHWTFEAADLAHRQSLPKFFLIASLSFLLNQMLYVFFLTYVPLPYYVSLPVVLIIVAAVTYLSSRLWAFAKAG